MCVPDSAREPFPPPPQGGDEVKRLFFVIPEPRVDCAAFKKKETGVLGNYSLYLVIILYYFVLILKLNTEYCQQAKSTK